MTAYPITPIDVARDLVGLRAVLPDFLEEAAEAGSPHRALRRPESAVPYAYRRWIEHLFLLDTLGDRVQLTADEALGLASLRNARDKFGDTHTRCPKCKAWLRAGSVIPCRCGWKAPANA